MKISGKSIEHSMLLCQRSSGFLQNYEGLPGKKDTMKTIFGAIED